MSVKSVEYYDIQRVLDRMASSQNFRPETSTTAGGLRNQSILADLSRNTSRLDRMKEYTAALSAKSRTIYTPALSAIQQRSAKQPQLSPRVIKQSSSPTPSLFKPHKQAKSMTTDIYCGPCLRDKLHHQAAGYCVECSEYFCETCIKHHRNLKITKYHTVRDRRQMPKVKHYIQEDETVEICELHLGELLRYFCKNHDEPCCAICATLNHRTCEDLIYIPEIEGIKTTKSCIAMIKHMNNLTKEFEGVRDGTEKCIKTLDTQKTDYEQKLEKMHKDFQDLLQSLEKDAEQNMTDVYDEEKAYLTSRVDTCNQAVQALQVSINNLDMAKQNGIESKIFLQMKKLSKQIYHFELLLADIKTKNNVPMKFTFKADDKVRDFLTSTEVLGAVDIKKKPQKTATIIAQFYVKSHSDVYPNCDITGSCVLDDGRIVLADMYNASLKVVDSSFHMVTQTKLSSEPWDLCATSSDQIVLTLPKEKKLQYFSINATIQPSKKIGSIPSLKNTAYYGVAYKQEKLYVTCPKDEPPCIKVLDMQGGQLQQIASTNSEEALFSDPLYLAITNDSKKLYISDSGNQSIITIDLKKGGTQAVYTLPQGNPPGGITVQKDGEVFICGFKTNSVLVMTGTGEFRDEIISGDTGLASPQSICYSAKHRQLIVTMQKSDIAQVYQLS